MGSWLKPYLRLIVAAIVLGGVLTSGTFDRHFSPHDPYEQNLSQRLGAPSFRIAGFLLGSDGLGRDVLSRIIVGSRITILIGFGSVVLAALLGIPLGLLSGYVRGRLDSVIMTLSDIQLAFPFLLLPIVISSVLGPGLVNTVVSLGIPGWVTFGRVVRAEVLKLREFEFVEAARAIGAGDMRIVRVTIFPNVLPSVLIVASFAVARMIVTEAALSFLGLSVPPPIVTWGGMINDGREYVYAGWWISVFPGLAITGTVVALNLLGDWLRDWLDPRGRYRFQ